MWIHKKCSGLKKLGGNLDFRCPHCLGTARAIDGKSMENVLVGTDSLEAVDSFCYLGDMLSAAGGCGLATKTRVKMAWKKYCELMPVLTTHHLSLKARGHIYSICIRSAMLHARKTWPLSKPNLLCLQKNDRAMIRLMYHVKPEEVAMVPPTGESWVERP